MYLLHPTSPPLSPYALAHPCSPSLAILALLAHLLLRVGVVVEETAEEVEGVPGSRAHQPQEGFVTLGVDWGRLLWGETIG